MAHRKGEDFVVYPGSRKGQGLNESLFRPYIDPATFQVLIEEKVPKGHSSKVIQLCIFRFQRAHSHKKRDKTLKMSQDPDISLDILIKMFFL